MIWVVQTHFKVHMDVVENSGKRVIDAWNRAKAFYF